jgi:asparagine synthase (glutamine-hydrolysing)
MCSIFTVVNKRTYIDVERCQKAYATSQLRGPDYSYTYIKNNMFVGCNVLSVTGVPKDNYFKHNNLFLAYNGEIYNEYNHIIPDTNYILNKFAKCRRDYSKVLSNLDGMFGIVLYDEHTNNLVIARDVQGEKTLYVYEDENQFIISSTLIGIDTYIGGLQIDYTLHNYYLHTRHFLTYNRSIYKNVRQVQPGSYVTYNTIDNTQKKYIYKRLTDAFCEKTLYENDKRSQSDLVEELDYILDRNVKQMIPRRACSVSFSGGIDSSLIAAYVNKHTSDFLPIATNCIGKDYIASDLACFSDDIKPLIITLNITEKEWYDALWETYKILRMPLPSHNYCTKKILAEYLNKNNVKVCFGGEGADELFGGYDFYHNISNTSKNTSPYSSFIECNIHDKNVYTEALSVYLNRVWQHFYKITGNSVLATSYTDTFLVVADDGLRNSDQICGHYGIEGRSPFMRWDIIKFALNLPSKYKRGKVLLRDLFSKYYPNVKISEKQGFAGFPCESYKYFYKKKSDFDILTQLNIKHEIHTPVMLWKVLNLQYFYECYNSRYIFNHS